MTDAGRVLHAGLHLLDRQLLSRDDRLCGKVDDLELSDPDQEGNLYVAAVLTGPGALMLRVGRTRLGAWLRRFAGDTVPGPDADPVSIPFGRVADIGNHITLSVDDEDVATFGGERWCRDHLISHLPGSGHATDG